MHQAIEAQHFVVCSKNSKNLDVQIIHRGGSKVMREQRWAAKLLPQTTKWSELYPVVSVRFYG
jgi:hypothetical protein